MIQQKEEKYMTYEFELPREDIELLIKDIDPEGRFRNPQTGQLQYEFEGSMIISCMGAVRSIKMKRLVIVR